MIALRAPLLGIATLALAVLTSWHAALLFLRGQNPGQAPALFARDPELLVEHFDTEFDHRQGNFALSGASLRQIAEAALTRDPLNPAAMRQLGLIAAHAAPAGGGLAGGGLAQFIAAEEITRRDMAN